MLERLQGKDGRAALLNALRSQFVVDGNSEIAEKVASVSQLKEFSAGSELFSQGERSSDLCLILDGEVSVAVDGRETGTISAGNHVGEVALLEPFHGRTATVTAKNTVVAAQITAQKFTDIATLHPELWRRIAIELARRLVKSQSKG